MHHLLSKPDDFVKNLPGITGIFLYALGFGCGSTAIMVINIQLWIHFIQSER
jgi:hypothetical protein